MKRYRLTKLTVKTREVISSSQNAADENLGSRCPICRTPLATPLNNIEFSVIKPLIKQQTTAEINGAQNKELIKEIYQ